MFGFAAAAAAAATTAPSPAVTHHTYEDTASAVAGEQSSPAQSLHATNTSRPRAPSEADEAEDVDGHQWTEENLSGLKNRELQDILARLGLKKSGKKKELVDRILGREVVEKNKPKWKNSKARALLVKLLMDKDSSVHSMTWQQIHSSHEWFSEFDAKSFKKYVKGSPLLSPNYCLLLFVPVPPRLLVYQAPSAVATAYRLPCCLLLFPRHLILSIYAIIFFVIKLMARCGRRDRAVK